MVLWKNGLVGNIVHMRQSDRHKAGKLFSNSSGNERPWQYFQLFCELMIVSSVKHMTERLTHMPKWVSLMVQMIKNLPAVQETRVQSLGQEDPLEKGMATHPCILAWRIPWAEETGGLQSMGSPRVGQN